MIRDYLNQLQPRERRLVSVAAVVLAVFLPYTLIWSPLANRAETLQDQVAKQSEQLQWMRSAVQEIRQLKGSSGALSSGKPLLSQIEQTASRSRLRETIRKIQPEGERGARIWMDNAAFDDVLLWLDQLHKQGIDVVDMSVERQAEPGRANIRLLLEAV